MASLILAPAPIVTPGPTDTLGPNYKGKRERGRERETEREREGEGEKAIKPIHCIQIEVVHNYSLCHTTAVGCTTAVECILTSPMITGDSISSQLDAKRCRK